MFYGSPLSCLTFTITAFSVMEEGRDYRLEFEDGGLEMSLLYGLRCKKPGRASFGYHFVSILLFFSCDLRSSRIRLMDIRCSFWRGDTRRGRISSDDSCWSGSSILSSGRKQGSFVPLLELVFSWDLYRSWAGSNWWCPVDSSSWWCMSSSICVSCGPLSGVLCLGLRRHSIPV